MSGPIVRTGTNPKFWEGWDKAFAKSGGSTAKKSAEAAKAPAAPKKTAKKTAKKSPKKKA